MSELKASITIKEIVIILIIVLVFSFAVLLSRNELTPIVSTPTPIAAVVVATPESKLTPSSVSVKAPEPVKTRFVSGLIKEVKKDSIIIVDVVTQKEMEIAFDETTKILVGSGTGKDGIISDLSSGWNAAVFLPENKNNNIAKSIQLIVKNK